MHWNIQSQLTKKSNKDRQKQIVKLALKNRGLTTQKQIDQFLNPPNPLTLTSSHTKVSAKSLQQATSIIKQAIKSKTPIIVYGDYDADGISATAILWETLHLLGAKAFPFIPHRELHGYGLSIKGIQDALENSKLKQLNTKPLFITVDNGIVAHKATQYLADNDYQLIITDHHQYGKTTPQADVIVHSDQICGAAVAWCLSKALIETLSPTNKTHLTSTLDLLAIGTIADLMPMNTLVNRSFAKAGLEVLTHSKRPGIQALKTLTNIEPDTPMSSYHVGYIIGPRINAMGRIDHGLDALRLLCTNSADKATQLAQLLSDTNETRQVLTHDHTQIAQDLYLQQDTTHNLIIIEHQEFHEGVIGLIAGKLTEKYYKPTIVISKGEEVSKASARSVSGINIIQLIRTASQHLLNAGGHPGAAGFSLETKNIQKFKDTILKTADHQIDSSLLQPKLDIDIELSLSDLNLDLYHLLEQFEPFGLQNSIPLFTTTAQVKYINTVGQDSAHLRLKLIGDQNEIDAIGFRLGEWQQKIFPGDQIQLAFTLNKNEWKGKISPQLIVKDIKLK